MVSSHLSNDLIRNLRKGDRHALARIISRIENRADDVQEIVAALYPHAGRAQVWGFTGPPGAGKSSLVDRIASYLRAEKPKPPRVAIVAVDPSSPFTGGAILGDRIRMQNHFDDPGVYIRSLGTRGHHGGLSQATREVVLALDAAGYDVILVETVGVGQTELEILQLADTTTVVLVPESGDSIQVMKAGLMEIADVFAVNKCDRPEADKMVRELTNLVALNSEMSHPSPGETARSWVNRIVQTQATSDLGTATLVAAIREHQEYLRASGTKEKKAISNVIEEVCQILFERMRNRYRQLVDTGQIAVEIQKVVARKSDPYSLAVRISEKFRLRP